MIIIDCQTTGMRPSVGSLLEIAWCRVTNSGEFGSEISPKTFPEPEIHSRLVELPEGEEIPWRVQEITGISAHEMVNAVSRETVLSELREALDGQPLAIIHYAQFEKPFLLDLFGGELPFEIFCSHQLTKKLFPQLPSRNIRGVSGFFGNRVGEVKRAASHVRATIEIWRGLVEELERKHITTWEELTAWGNETPKIKGERTKKYEYRIEREQRLKLPAKPGVYRMIAKSGEVLYVGKATSLKDRVNSYFRGRKGRDPRKLEMLTQVWDLNYTECGSALEAALLETDEIKRFDPPYNVSLKMGRRKLIFYSRDFQRVSDVQDDEHPLGAFRTFNCIEDLKLVLRSLTSPFFLQVFHTVIPMEDLESGFDLFCARVGVHRSRFTDVRSMLALGLKLYRKKRNEVEAEVESETDEGESEVNTEERLTPEEVSGKFERLFIRAGRTLARARMMTKLLNARVSWEAETGPRSIEVHGGKIWEPAEPGDSRHPWRGLDISDYDRMSVLVSGIAPVPHSIESRLV